MIISYHGVECVKVQFGDKVLVFNPISKDSKFGAVRFGADVAFISLNHPDMNGAESVAYGERKPFVATGPGEYEIKGIFAEGLAGGESAYSGEKFNNTIYLVTLEGIKICFLGALNTPNLPTPVQEATEEVDILFVPIGGNGVLGPADAYKVAVSLEPKIIIPIHFGEVGDKNALKTFLKEGGAENEKAEDKLTLKKKDLEGKEGDIVVLNKA
ncbi:MAG: MBL fold metallo-hydrolase [Candidatus Paceibacterota bacterium]|jgi:L-ascorbate metabolism protein UlaG (beta-lactamase superfamily)